MGQSWSVVDLSSDTPLEKTDFPFDRRYQLQLTATNILARVGTLRPLASVLRPCLVHSATVSVSSYGRQFCYIWRTLFIWSHPSPQILKIVLPLLLHSTLTLGGGECGIDEDIPFRTEHSRVSHSL